MQKRLKALFKKLPPYMIIELALIIVVVGCFGYYYLSVRSDAHNNAPEIVITANSDDFSVNANEQDFLNGVTANDKEDGDVTDSIIIESISPFVSENTRVVTYVAFDSHNNIKKYDREIHYTDYEKPSFENDSHIYVNKGTANEILAQMSVIDVIDGDISSQVKLETNDIKAGVPNDYNVKATVTNSCGDVVSSDIVVTVTGEEDAR